MSKYKYLSPHNYIDSGNECSLPSTPTPPNIRGWFYTVYRGDDVYSDFGLYKGAGQSLVTVEEDDNMEFDEDFDDLESGQIKSIDAVVGNWGICLKVNRR